MVNVIKFFKKYIVYIAIIVLAFLCISLALQIKQSNSERKNWYAKYLTENTIKEDALGKYGTLVKEVEAEKEYREQQQKAYEKLKNYHYVGKCKLTAYCCEKYPHICGTGNGITATGIPVQPGVVAVDPSVIPLGSTVIIDGVSYIAADTGGAIKGNIIDIAFETHQEASGFGIHYGEVWYIVNDK